VGTSQSRDAINGLSHQLPIERRKTMNSMYRVPALLAGVVGLSVVVSTLNAQTKSPVYAVIDISEAMDADAYVKAVSAAEPKATQSAGGRFMIRTNKPIALDGGAPPNRFVVIAFDNEEQAKAWYNSQAIKDVNAVRMKVTRSRAFLVEGLAN
jgi:uncharacterized protein (DUF1330 family)